MLYHTSPRTCFRVSLKVAIDPQKCIRELLCPKRPLHISNIMKSCRCVSALSPPPQALEWRSIWACALLGCARPLYPPTFPVIWRQTTRFGIFLCQFATESRPTSSFSDDSSVSSCTLFHLTHVLVAGGRFSSLASRHQPSSPCVKHKNEVTAATAMCWPAAAAAAVASTTTTTTTTNITLCSQLSNYNY